MKIAVTGGTGFIGRALVERLARAGHSVIVLTRRPEDRRGLPAEVGTALFDVDQPLSPQTLKGVEAVVHLAGENVAAGRWTKEHKERVLESRRRGTANVARAAVESGTVKTLLSASGVGFYGDRGDELLTEESSGGGDFLAQVCGVWEEATHPARDAGVRTVPLRIGLVLHPEGGSLAKMLLPFKLGAGGKFGSGKQYMSWIHRDDALGLMEHALMTQAVRGPMNVVAPNPVTNAEFTRALGLALRRPAVVPVPGFALKVALGEMAEVLLGGQRVSPKRALETGYVFRFPTLEAALADLPL